MPVRIPQRETSRFVQRVPRTTSFGDAQETKTAEKGLESEMIRGVFLLLLPALACAQTDFHRKVKLDVTFNDDTLKNRLMSTPNRQLRGLGDVDGVDDNAGFGIQTAGVQSALAVSS